MVDECFYRRSFPIVSCVTFSTQHPTFEFIPLLPVTTLFRKFYLLLQFLFSGMSWTPLYIHIICLDELAERFVGRVCTIKSEREGITIVATNVLNFIYNDNFQNSIFQLTDSLPGFLRFFLLFQLIIG